MVVCCVVNFKKTSLRQTKKKKKIKRNEIEKKMCGIIIGYDEPAVEEKHISILDGYIFL